MDYNTEPSELKRIGQMPAHLARPIATAPEKYIHSELHEFIDETRKRFGETAKKGPGSFGVRVR